MISIKTFIVAFSAVALSTAAPARRIDPHLDEALAAFVHDEHPDLQGVVVLHDGRVVAERYYNDETANSLHDIRSAERA